MDQRPSGEGQPEQQGQYAIPPQPVFPTPGPGAQAMRPSVDRFPKSDQDWTVFSALPADVRCAAYLRSIRSMLLFFTVLTIIGIVLAVVFTLLGINAIDQGNINSTSGFGQ
jgi:hypothetical protein